ncbi:MAG: glycine--tRNA ligase subunit beta [Acidobacteriaceae bacterium]|jgi:glycyl-tRNA synthetase beta chain
MAEFLFEIGLEEVPARMIAFAQEQLGKSVVNMLSRERLINLQGSNRWTPNGGLELDGEIFSRTYSTPRRLALWVREVSAVQPNVAEKLMGPAVKIAYKDGVPGPAAMAFARKAGVPEELLGLFPHLSESKMFVIKQGLPRFEIVTTPKGDYLAATSVKAGRAAAEVIAEEMPKEVAGIYWAKNMYWRAGKPERFVRPVRWLLALLGDAVVPVSFGGKTAGNATRGHRVLAGDGPIPVAAPGEYEQTLLGAHVIADVEARRQKIRKALDRVTREAGDGLRWREDHALVDTVTHLTEWPTVIAGAFEPEYLALPEEVLVTVMRDHQKYFAVEQGTGNREQEGPKLAANFLAVLNTETDAQGEAVIRHGNERVLRARFNDARFFWEFDQRVPLTQRVELLEKVTFQKDLGSYAAKSARVLAVAERLATRLAERACVLDGPALVLAVRLAKTDLTTELVKEFTELQGEVGGLYARAQGHGERVALAIYDQYRPQSMEDRVPRSAEGAVLALADKVDTIVGMFGLGLEPTGSKDPFALRRAANGIVKILAEAQPALPLTLGDVVDAASASEAVRVRVEIFFAERLEFYLREAKGQAYDVVKAVLAAGANDVRDAVARAEAVTAVRGSEDFAAVSAAFKRMKNILAQAGDSGEFRTWSGVSGSAVEPAIAELLEASEAARVRVTELIGVGNYVASLETIARLRPLVDRFFDEVMVMDPNPAVRRGNLVLLLAIVDDIQRIADLSEIVTQG